jgi:MinD-like ATPase involved in chromosome partitioning or flagellar assembly
MFLDEFEEEFYSYDNSNAELPIVPKFSEKHDCLIIVSDNEIDTTFLETTFNIQNAQSYKNTKTGKAMVINVNQVRDQWIKSR